LSVATKWLPVDAMRAVQVLVGHPQWLSLPLRLPPSNTARTPESHTSLEFALPWSFRPQSSSIL
jgi:hypothetical protein